MSLQSTSTGEPQTLMVRARPFTFDIGQVAQGAYATPIHWPCMQSIKRWISTSAPTRMACQQENVKPNPPHKTIPTLNTFSGQNNLWAWSKIFASCAPFNNPSLLAQALIVVTNCNTVCTVGQVDLTACDRNRNRNENGNGKLGKVIRGQLS